MGVDEPLAVAVQSCVGHGPQVDEEAELVACAIFSQIHVRAASSGQVEEAV